MKLLRFLVIISALTFLCAIVFAGYIHFGRPKNTIIHPDIQKQITFSYYLPSEGSHFVKPESVQFDQGENILKFTVNFQSISVDITQQLEPSIFKEPQVFQSLLNKMNQYDEFQSRVGTVTLTKPTEREGRQTAVINTNGSVLFANTNSDLTSAKWKEFFDEFELSR